jgi:hypothetical protein
MRWINITILTILTILMALTATTTADTLRQDSTHTVCRLTTAEAAIARALAYTGFDKLESYSRSVQVVAEQMSVGETDPEVLRAEFDGKQLWRVDFDNVTFDSSGGCARDFEVYLDAERGRLIHIWSCCQSGGCDTVLHADWVCRSPEWQSEHMSPAHEFISLLDEPPATTFADILNRLFWSQHGAKAKLVTGLLVAEAHSDGEPRPAWLVTLSGMPGMPSPHASLPSFQWLRMSAASGKPLDGYLEGPPDDGFRHWDESELIPVTPRPKPDSD